MPDCTLTALDGSKPFTLKQFQGKVLYVDFWASWCGPCAKSFPFLNQLNQLETSTKTDGLQIVGINLDENLADAQEFLGKYPAQFTVAADAQQECAKTFDVKAMPSSYLVDRKGQVRHVHLGFKPGEAEELQQLVAKLLAEQ